MRVQLFAPNGQLVAEIDVPKFSVYPRIIVWSGRYFVLDAGRYVEAFTYQHVGAAVAA